MAQWGRKFKYFESHWRPKVDLATRIVRDIQAHWAGSDDPFPARKAVAIILSIFASEPKSGRSPLSDQNLLWKRSTEEWLSIVNEPEAECDQFVPARSPEERRDLVSTFCNLIENAVNAWEIDLGSPTPEQVIEELMHEIDSRRWSIIKYD